MSLVVQNLWNVLMIILKMCCVVSGNEEGCRRAYIMCSPMCNKNESRSIGCSKITKMDVQVSSSMLYENKTDEQLSKAQSQFMFLYKEPEYQVFFQDYLSVNVPCLLSCGVTSSWNACKHWVNARGQPNLHDLCQKFGESSTHDKINIVAAMSRVSSHFHEIV